MTVIVPPTIETFEGVAPLSVPIPTSGLAGGVAPAVDVAVGRVSVLARVTLRRVAVSALGSGGTLVISTSKGSSSATIGVRGGGMGVVA
jgi:hypothetical protein